MNLLIHFIEFDIIFCIEDNIVEKVYEFWKNCLDICYIDFNIEVKMHGQFMQKKFQKEMRIIFGTLKKK